MPDKVGVRDDAVDCPVIDNDPPVIFPTAAISPVGPMTHLSVHPVGAVYDPT